MGHPLLHCFFVSVAFVLPFSKFRSRLFHCFSAERRYLTLRRACLFFWIFCAGVQILPTGSSVINQIQRWVATLAHKIWMLPGEDPGDFNRRRHQAVTGICRRDGLWGERVNRRFLSWVHHAARSSARPNHSWFPSLLTWHDDTWLTAQRMAFGGLDAGSTGTRVQQGRPSQRLAQSFDFAMTRVGRG